MSLKGNRLCRIGSVIAVFLFCGLCPVFGSGWKTLHGHVPAIVAHLIREGDFPATNQLHLALGLPLRDQPGLSDFLKQVYTPGSPNFRKFLTPAEFTSRFGPSSADYATIQDFARSNGLVITKNHGNRLLLDVSGPVGAINHAFHITLRRYRHPVEQRDFYAPDSEPMVDAGLPLADISGLDNAELPRPQLHSYLQTAAVPQAGSGSGGSYLGNDFRAAYVPGTTLNGAGQQIGLLEFDGYFTYDLGIYEGKAGLPNIPVEPVLLDNVSGVPGFSGGQLGEAEVSLDIEMAMSMAPGVAGIVVFEGNTPNDILNAMVASNQVNQLSSSWEWGGGPSTTTDNIFQEMAAQGQSYFNCSGDNLAYTPGTNSSNGVDNPALLRTPSSSPYITVVGGTTLSTSGPGGSWMGETVWNSGSVGSGGGVSSVYPIPYWQTNLNFSSNGGSGTQRNIPDVAMAGDNILVCFGDGEEGYFSGTSCATPLWAGFTALANQQAAAMGGAPLGFLNPALYGLVATGNNSVYANYFHDITSGNNEWAGSPAQYMAVTGYDLCTGLGSPAGTNLINALVGLDDPFEVLPGTNLVVYGPPGGPFSSGQFLYALTNSGAATLGWTLSGVPPWLTASAASGTLTVAGQSNLSLSLNSVASNLVVGTYGATLAFSNVTSHIAQIRLVTLQVVPALQTALVAPFAPAGPFGGPFNPPGGTLAISNFGAAQLTWSLINTSAWLTASPAAGIVPAGGSPALVTLGVSPSATLLPPGAYPATLLVTNPGSQVAQTLTVNLAIGQSLVANGGFESGNFTDWTLVGDPIYYGANNNNAFYDAVISAGSFQGAGPFVHSGAYSALLGESGYLATISQTIPTVPGQVYLLSFWLLNSTNVPTAHFQADWAGNTVYDSLNPPVFGWTNEQFLVVAKSPATVLQFGAENDLGFFALDDVSLVPVPAPAFNSIAPVGNSFQLTAPASPGLVYQIQYKTNLLQSDWIGLGVPVTALTNFVMLADTNLWTSSSRRFYRLEVSP